MLSHLRCLLWSYFSEKNVGFIPNTKFWCYTAGPSVEWYLSNEFGKLCCGWIWILSWIWIAVEQISTSDRLRVLVCKPSLLQHANLCCATQTCLEYWRNWYKLLILDLVSPVTPVVSSSCIYGIFCFTGDHWKNWDCTYGIWIVKFCVGST